MKPEEMPEVISVDTCGTDVVEEWIVELTEHFTCASYVRKDLLKPAPSKDFTEVLSNPNKRFLVYCSNNKLWFIGHCRYGDSFVTVEGTYLIKYQPVNITHWLPLPNNP